MMVRESGIPGLDWFEYDYDSGDVHIIDEETPDIFKGSMPPYEYYLDNYNDEVNDFSHELNGKKYYQKNIPYKPENYHELYPKHITPIGGYSDQVGEMYTMDEINQKGYIPMQHNEEYKRTNYGYPGVPGGLGQFDKKEGFNNSYKNESNKHTDVFSINDVAISITWLHLILIFIIIILCSIAFTIREINLKLSISRNSLL